MKQITIDGLSLTGKTTLAENLWSDTHSLFLSTGKVWRSVAQYYLVHDIDNLQGLMTSLEDYRKHDEDCESLGLFINEAGIVSSYLLNYTYSLNSYKKFDEKKVEDVLIYLSQSERLREFINDEIKHYLSWVNSNYEFEYFILEGRDCGSNIFPNADLKIFLYCSLEERVKKLIKRSKKLMSVTEARQHLINRDKAEEDNLMLTPEHINIRVDFKEVHQIINIIKPRLKELK